MRDTPSHEPDTLRPTRMLHRCDMDPAVVMSLGGWDSRDALRPYEKITFNDVICAELASAGLLEAGDGPGEASLPRVEQTLKSALDIVSDIRALSPETRTKQMSLRSLSPSDD